MYKRFVASFMTALMAAMTLVSPALGATALNTYPTFLGKVGDFYVVVGAKAASSDVAGAIDIAANLAQLSFKDTTVSGTTSTGLTGTERKISIPTSGTGGQIGGTGANNLPNKLRAFHFSGLKEGQYEYRGTKHNYHEEVELDDSGTTLTLSHSTSSPINGTLKMRLENNATTYKYVFDDTISSADFSASAANSTTYTNPLKVPVAGKEFQIVAVPATASFIALVGDVKTLSDGESLTVGGLTFKVTQSFSSSTAKIEITDSAGNVVKTGINTGSTESVSFGGATYNYRVLSSGATASGVPGYAQLLAGKGDIEKTFDGSDTATITEFGSSWRISGTFAAASRVQNGDYIKVVYDPASLTDATRYFLAGSKFTGPNNYFELNYAGYSPDKFAKVTVAPTTGVTAYDSTLSTGYKTVTGLAGLKIWSDVAGTLVYGASGYSEVYVLFNGTVSAGNFNGTAFWLAYKDTATGRVVTLDNTTYPVGSNTIPGGSAISLDPTPNTWEYTVSYGGPGAQVTYVLNNSLGSSNAAGIFNADLWVTGAATRQAALEFQNKSTASVSSAPELRLGATSTKVDSNDVQTLIEASLADVSDQVGTVLTDGGVQVYTVKTNTESDKVELGIPPETVYGLMKFGKIGEAATTTGGTIKEVIAVTTAVAKLDTEVTTADKAGKHIVTVGGPCVNTVTADALKVTYPACGAASTIPENKAVVQVIDDVLATGKKVVVVAGWRAEDTRLASSVLQNYATKLSGITASKVEVAGTALATATVTSK